MRNIFLGLMLLITTSSFAQKRIFDHAVHIGLLRAEGSLALGEGKINRYFWQGELEYLMSDRVGANGMTYIDFTGGPNYPHRNHSIFSGPAFHFPIQKQIDFSIAVQPGLSIVSRKNVYAPFVEIEQEKTTLIPCASTMLSIAYYGSFFHVFAQTRGVAAFLNNGYHRENLSDVRFSFGLGWNLSVLK